MLEQFAGVMGEGVAAMDNDLKPILEEVRDRLTKLESLERKRQSTSELGKFMMGLALLVVLLAAAGGIVAAITWVRGRG
jgi:hypothetical protein